MSRPNDSLPHSPPHIPTRSPIARAQRTSRHNPHIHVRPINRDRGLVMELLGAFGLIIAALWVGYFYGRARERRSYDPIEHFAEPPQ